MARSETSGGTLTGADREASENCAKAQSAKETIQAPGTLPGASPGTSREVVRLTLPPLPEELAPLRVHGGAFEYAGRRYTKDDWEEDWFIEFVPEEAAELEPLRCIDTQHCCMADVMKCEEAYFLTWSEPHPQCGTIEEFFGHARTAPFAPSPIKDRSEETLAAWFEHEGRYPRSHYARPLTRRQARDILVYFWIPEEFHAELLAR